MTMINRCLTGKSSGYDHPRFLMLQLLWGMVTGTNLIVSYVMSINDKIPKRPLSFQHIIKLDHPLGNLKFERKGSKDLVYGMPIPDVMLNNVIKASADYSKKRSQTVTEEIGQSEEAIDYKVKFKGTDGEEVTPLVRCRFTGVSIVAQYKLDMKKSQKSSKDDIFIQQRFKGPGVGSVVTPEVPNVQTLNCTNEGGGMTSKIPNEPSDASSNSSFDLEIAVEDISSDDDDDVTKKPNKVTKNTNEVTEKDDEVIVKPGVVIENADNVTMADEVQPAEQQVRNAEHGPNIEPASDTQADVQIVYRLERKVIEMSKFDIQAVIDKSDEARLKQIELLKGVLGFKKIKLEKAAKQNVPNTSWNKIAIAIYDQKSRLYIMMKEVKAFNSHPANKDMYDALAVSLSIDEDDMDRIFDQAGSSKQGKSSSKPSKSNKPIDADEVIHEVEIDTGECIEDAVHDSSPTAPSKDQNEDTGPEQNWFPELEESAKAPKDFDDVLGSTFDFSNFIKYRLKKDTLTKVDLEGPVFELFKRSSKSCIKLEYHLEQRYLAISDKLD
ncbi:hypothetical protein Tco_0613631 [Tanacetum coccineum]